MLHLWGLTPGCWVGWGGSPRPTESESLRRRLDMWPDPWNPLPHFTEEEIQAKSTNWSPDPQFSALSTHRQPHDRLCDWKSEQTQHIRGVFPFLFSFNNNKHDCAVTHKMLITLPDFSFKLLAWSIRHFNNKKPFSFQYTFNFLFLINIKLNISTCGRSLLIYWKLILFPGNVTWVALLG